MKLNSLISVLLCSGLAALAAAPVLWQSEGIVLNDLGKLAEPKENLCKGLDRYKWDVVDYETTRYNGSMLYTRRGTTPKPVTIDPKLEGWYRIYIATLSNENNGARLWMRIDGEPGPTMFSHGNTAVRWSATEMGEEIFMKCADLTGRKLTFGKPAGKCGSQIGIMWLRFEPMTEAEIADYKATFTDPATKRLHAHSDMDWIHIYGPDATMDEYCSIIDAYGRSDVAMATIEVYTTLGDKTQPYLMYNNGDKDLLEFRWPSQLALDAKRKEVYKEYVRRAEGYGIKLLAGHRMSLANFLIPADDICCSNIPFVTNNPQWYCKDRDGEPLAVLSYAYPEVGDFMINQFLQMADMGFHGATLLLHRGVEILFEEPVVARFKERYPDVDPLTLSLNDERLAAVRCEFFTDFVRRLRKAFDAYSEKNGRPRLAIVPYVGFGLADNKRLGLDVETWVKEKLVDGVCVACMRVFENEGAFKNEDGTLSVEKYHQQKKAADRSPQCRAFGNMADEMAKFIPEYGKLEAESGVKFYYDIQWEGSIPPEGIVAYVQKLYNAGAQNLSMWDCFEFRITHRAEWLVTSRLGHKDQLGLFPTNNAGYRRLFRMISLNGVKYDGYHPSWRG
jgi:hypothetical protein